MKYLLVDLNVRGVYWTVLPVERIARTKLDFAEHGESHYDDLREALGLINDVQCEHRPAAVVLDVPFEHEKAVSDYCKLRGWNWKVMSNDLEFPYVEVMNDLVRQR